MDRKLDGPSVQKVRMDRRLGWTEGWPGGSIRRLFDSLDQKAWSKGSMTRRRLGGSMIGRQTGSRFNDQKTRWSDSTTRRLAVRQSPQWSFINLLSFIGRSRFIGLATMAKLLSQKLNVILIASCWKMSGSAGERERDSEVAQEQLRSCWEDAQKQLLRSCPTFRSVS